MVAYIILSVSALYVAYRALAYHLHARKAMSASELDRLLLQKLNEKERNHEKTGKI